MREFTVYAPAKLNLYLDVLAKRPDGYHNIETIFEKIDLKDEIIIKEHGVAKGINVRSDSAACPQGEDNIVYKALSILLRETDTRLGIEVVINKNIPIAAGLGGGSSDAAAVLHAINDKFELGVSEARLFAIAAETGRDVPFFLNGRTFAKGSGTGEKLRTIDSDWSLSHIIIKPDVYKSTREMYRRLDSYSDSFGKGDIKKVISAFKAKDFDLLRESFYNIFEEMLLIYGESVVAAKEILREFGAGMGFLSGSGPSVFCILKEREEAIAVRDRIPEKKGMRVFVATSCKN